MNIAVIGLSHKTTPVEVREKLSIPEADLQDAFAQLRAYPSIEEISVLSTCNRLEIYFIAKDMEAGVREVSQFLCDRSGMMLSELRPYLFVLLHQDAVMHLMRVSAGLESLVLGEGQILAQVKTTHKQGQKNKGIGRILNQLFKQAIGAGKRVRTETSIGTGAVSISSAAVELAQLKLAQTDGGCLKDLEVCIVGAGKMSKLLIKHLLSKGADRITLVNRSQRRAEELAGQYPSANIAVRPLTEMLDAVAASNLAFTSTGATQPILTKANLEPIVDADGDLVLVDISVPRNIAADVTGVAGIRCFNVDDLKAVVAQNQESRRQMALEAEALLEEEVANFETWWQSLETVPTISSLRKKIEGIREQELEKALSRLGTEFDDKHQEVIESLTRGIVNKILHDPMVQLRAQQDLEARRVAMHTLRTLFSLEEETAKR
ncbi:MAG: glutamyl-tRNA reductase [Geitlerinemataceae cyanobacterium]